MVKANGFYIGLMFDRAAVRHGSAPVILDQPLQLAPELGSVLCVDQLADLVRRLAGRLVAAGVRRGDHVVVYKTNNVDIALLASAVQRTGAVPVLLSPALDGDTVSRLLRRLRRPWLVIDALKLGLGALDLDTCRGVLLSAGKPSGNVIALADFADAPIPEPAVPGLREPAFISHTSGTTGLPKLVVQTPEALWHRLRLQKLVALRTWRRESVALCLSLVHARFYSALQLGISYGNPLLVALDAGTANIGPLFVTHRPGVVETQPNTFVAWEELAGASGRPLASIRYYSATFDAMHPRTVQVLLGASARRRPLFFQLYGQTETGPVTAKWISLRGARHADGRCVGWPLPGVVKLRIADGRGRRLKPGEVGYIEVRSNTRAITYLGEAGRFAAELTDGWWRMGDLGCTDRWGRVYLLDREIDQLESVESNLRIEDELMSVLPELREVVIVAGSSGEPVPVVCTRNNAPLDSERWHHAVAGLPQLAPPRQIPFERLPLTATWKIRRPELVRMLEEGAHDRCA